MKKLLMSSLGLALIPTTALAGRFGPDAETITLRNQLAQEHNATAFWMTVAGVLAIAIIIAFIAGTILGSKTRRNGTDIAPHE